MASFLNMSKRFISLSSTINAIAGMHKARGGKAKTFKMLTYFVCFPTIGLAMSHCYYQHKEHPHQRIPFVPYEHVRIRTKRFPWGDGNKTFFHNPKLNALPEGYEDEPPYQPPSKKKK